jgi:general secretion pathway protein F
MSQYLVKTARSDGSLEEVHISADSEIAAARAARQRGLTPLSVHKSTGKSTQKVRGAAEAATRLARELSALVGAGLTVERALQSLQKFGDSTLTGKVARDLLAEVRAGKPLSQAFESMPEIFPPPFPQVAEAGEASSSLPEAMAGLADWREQRQRFESEMKGSLIYPVILLVFSFLMVTLLMVFVVPKFQQVFSDMGATPPAFAGFVFGLSQSMGTYLPYIAGILLVGFLALSAWLRRPRSRYLLYRWSHQLPVIGEMSRAMLAARFCRVLAVLLQNGLSAAPAFRLAAAGLTDDYAKEKLMLALEQVRRGSSLPDQIEQAGILPPLATEILRVGEETGDLAPVAKRLADLYEGRLERGTKMAVRLIEPIMILLVGLVVGAIVLSVMLAMISINELGM